MGVSHDLGLNLVITDPEKDITIGCSECKRGGNSVSAGGIKKTGLLWLLSSDEFAVNIEQVELTENVLFRSWRILARKKEMDKNR